MIRRSAALLSLVSMVLLLFPFTVLAQSGPGEFTFVHVTDVHIGGAGSHTAAAKVFAAIKEAKPQFLIDTGDATEMGRLAEYDAYQQYATSVGVPIYAVPGNHDVRWFDAGHREFIKRFGQPYRSFTHGGVHFVLLDTSIDAETHGHFHESMLQWMERDLAAIGTEMPVFIFFHHPIGFRPLNFVDNEQRFYDAVAPYNVRGIFTGHGHLNYQWQINNIPHFMTQAGFEDGWRKLTVRADHYETTEGTFSLRRPSGPGSIKIGSVTQDAQKLEVFVEANNLPEGAIVYMRSGGAWQPMNQGPYGWAGTLWTESLPAGIHDLEIYATAEPNLPGQAATDDQWIRRDLGAAWTAMHRFEKTAAGGARLLWRYQADGSVQGPLSTANGRVFVTASDGTVTALDSATGALLWSTPVSSSPISAGTTPLGDAVLTGTTTGTVVSLSQTTGEIRWERALSGAVLAEPEYGHGMVFAGTAAGDIYGLSATTGDIIWKAHAGATVRSRPTYAHGMLFAGTWGGEVLAFDALSGRELWRTKLTTNAYLSPANVPLTYYRGRVYASNSTGGSLPTGLWSIDARTGKVLWAAEEAPGYSSPFLLGTDIVANTSGGRLFGVNPLTGERTWSVALGTSIFDSYAVQFGGGAAATGLYGRVTAATSKQVLWKFDVGDTFVFARLAVAGDRLYAGTMEGYVYALQAPAPAQPQPTPFADTATHWSGESVAAAHFHGLVSGYEDGAFRPGNQVTRAEMAAMLARYLGLAPVEEPPFPDVEGHWAAGSIGALVELGLVGGRPGPDGTFAFEPDAPIARGEAVTLLARLLGRTAPSPTWQTQFQDMQDHWAHATVGALEELGLVGGYQEAEGMVFQPYGTLTRGEAAVLLMRITLPPARP